MATMRDDVVPIVERSPLFLGYSRNEIAKLGQELARLHPEDFFGEVAALDDGPRTASVRTITQVRCLGLPNGSFKTFLERNPRFAINVLHAIVRRFRAVVTSAPQRAQLA